MKNGLLTLFLFGIVLISSCMPRDIRNFHETFIEKKQKEVYNCACVNNNGRIIYCGDARSRDECINFCGSKRAAGARYNTSGVCTR